LFSINTAQPPSPLQGLKETVEEVSTSKGAR
jgi:hypothetical protein